MFTELQPRGGMKRRGRDVCMHRNMTEKPVSFSVHTKGVIYVFKMMYFNIESSGFESRFPYKLLYNKETLNEKQFF